MMLKAKPCDGTAARGPGGCAAWALPANARVSAMPPSTAAAHRLILMIPPCVPWIGRRHRGRVRRAAAAIADTVGWRRWSGDRARAGRRTTPDTGRRVAPAHRTRWLTVPPYRLLATEARGPMMGKVVAWGGADRCRR